MGLSILLGIILGLLLVLGIVVLFCGELAGMLLSIISGACLVCLIIIAPMRYFEEITTVINIENRIQSIVITESLIKEIDSELYNSTGIIDTVNKDKLSKMIDLKTSLADKKISLSKKIRYCLFKCDHKFLYIFPFDKEDFEKYEIYLGEGL